MPYADFVPHLSFDHQPTDKDYLDYYVAAHRYNRNAIKNLLDYIEEKLGHHCIEDLEAIMERPRDVPNEAVVS